MFDFRIAACSLVLCLTGCEALKGPQAVTTSKIDGPAVFAAAQSGQNAKISTGWLSEFDDARMTKLVMEALKHNNNLQSAAHRLRAAKEGTIIGGAARKPTVGASTGYRRSGGENVSFSASYSLSLNASWEPDLWGRLRNSDLASRADYSASLADYRGARLSLAANTARSWCNLVTAERQLDLAQRTVISYQKALPVVERRYKAQTLRAVDVKFARNNIASAERTLRSRRLSRDDAARVLETLLGRYPSATIASSSTLPTLSQNVPAGLPSELLARRPDLQAARADLFASAQRAEIFRKNLLPSLNLNGGLSNGDSSIRRAFDPNFLVYSVAASLAQTIYRGGALSAQARAALERNRAKINDYATSALLAFREVESAIDADHSLSEQETFLETEVEQSNLAEKRALDDIALGVEGASFLEYLEAQRRAESARAALIRLRNLRLQNRIDLHLALGGDFATP
ncbi:MAG: efflux transporter outer membrane subunit [Akkermansiaceae bacterium]|nr:efflux transporter outer membrane subunit [Akkermansiaceae bacterium]